MGKIEEIEARRAARKAQTKAAFEEQYATDLEALDALEVEHGDHAVATYKLDADRWKPGLPTLVVVHVPESAYNRFRGMVRKAKDNAEARGAAADLLADSCVAYPARETYSAMRAAYEGLHDNVTIIASKLAEGKSADEGKG